MALEAWDQEVQHQLLTLLPALVVVQAAAVKVALDLALALDLELAVLVDLIAEDTQSMNLEVLIALLADLWLKCAFV